MMEWIFWPTRVSYANDPVGTVLVGAVALLFGVGLGARLPRGKLRTALWGLPLFPLAAELLASPAYSREDWFLPVRLAFALDGLAAMALALWLGYALGTLFRRGEDAGRMLESWKTEVYDPTEEYLAHLRFGGTAFMIVGALTALAALLD